jgi:hypothetical protein
MPMTDIEKARQLFSDAELAFPTSPGEIAAQLKKQGEWVFATREIETSPYILEHYVSEVDETPVEDYAVLSHSGYGANSYAIQYYLVRGSLRMFLHLGWGGVYTNKKAATANIRNCFSLADKIVSAVLAAQGVGRFGAGEYLTVVGSDSYGSYWLPPGETRREKDVSDKDTLEVLTEALHWLTSSLTLRTSGTAQQKHRAMKRTEQKRRIVVGDIHGELDGFREILRNAKLIDSQDHWIGGDDILIQTGDVIDRGSCSRELIALLRKLEKEAAAAKGEVIRLCGNHELMLLQNNFSYVNFNDPESLIAELKEEIARGDLRASYFDGERLYSHAGLRSAIRETLVDQMKSAKSKSKTRKTNLFLLSDHINKIFKEAVEKNDLDQHPIFHVGRERGGTAQIGGIFWCDFSSISPSLEASMIPQIFGHTPTRKNGVRTAHGLKLIDVDAGMCRVFGDARVYLEITREGHLLQHSKSLSKWTRIPLGVQR